MDKLFEYFHKMIRETNIEFHRYIYSRINWNSRMIGLTGPRGVGKTTLVLQHIKEKLNLNDSFLWFRYSKRRYGWSLWRSS